MVKEMANLKGNLGLKSSSLAPTSSKLSTQYLVLDHMTNHYDKISKAKAAIDNKPPKSMTTSQKMRDRKTRQRVMSPHRIRPVSSMSHIRGQTNDDYQEYEDLLNEEPEDDEGRLVQSIMKNTLGKKSFDSNEATFNSKTQSYSYSSHASMKHENGDLAGGEHQGDRYQRPMSARSAHSVTSSTYGANRIPITSHDQKRITYNGDILDKRAYCFTEPDRPFTPRTLKSSHESRLKSSKCYNPPKFQSNKQNVTESSSVPEQGRERESRPRPQPRPQPRQRNRSGQSDQLGETIPTNKMSESMLMDITLQSRDGRFSQESKRDVPPLAISMDTDHFKWLQEQASKAQVRAKHSTKLKPGLHADSTMEDKDDESPLNLSHSIRLETLKNSRCSSSITSRRPKNPWIQQKLLKEEEEQKYLAFAKEVTDDVLTRGISTDKVLNKLFENHIERRKGDLDESRMRAMIKDLKKDLGLRDTSVDRKESHNVNFSNLDRNKSKSITLEQDTLSTHSESKETMSSKPEMLNGLTSNSNMTMTMESTSTMKFGQTGDLFSTIHSDQQDRDLSDGEVETSGKETETDKENDNELTATQVLKEYQMNLTAKEASGDVNGEVSSSELGHMNANTQDASESSERPATGERRMEPESSTENGRTTTDYSTPNSHGNQTSTQELSTSNGQASRSRLRNRRRQRTEKSSTASADSGSAIEEPSSNSAVKSSTTFETGSEREMSENGLEPYSKPAAKPRVGNVTKQSDHSEHSEQRKSDAEEMRSTGGRSGSVLADDYSGDYEDDYEDGSQGVAHHTSDDDF